MPDSSRFPHDPLAEPLRRAAELSEPPFSERLHASILSRLEVQRPPRKTTSMNRSARLALAASVLVVLGAIWAIQNSGQPGLPRASIETSPARPQPAPAQRAVADAAPADPAVVLLEFRLGAPQPLRPATHGGLQPATLLADVAGGGMPTLAVDARAVPSLLAQYFGN